MVKLSKMVHWYWPVSTLRGQAGHEVKPNLRFGITSDSHAKVWKTLHKSTSGFELAPMKTTTHNVLQGRI